MKAVILTEAGETENLKMQELPNPVPREEEILVSVKAISINPVDIKTRRGGALYASLREQQPVILGWDISGVVSAVGEKVNGFKAGDEVFGMVNFPGHGRAYAEYVAAPAAHFSLKPPSVSHEFAAASTLAALTAWQVLVKEAKIRKGHHVLIHAAAGGVGHFAVQIAKHFGAKVTGTASAENKGFLTALGVDTVVNYTRQNIAEEIKDVDIVLDPIGGVTTANSIATLKSGGTLISIVGGVKDHLNQLLQEKNILARNYLVQSNGEDMAELAALLQQGIVIPTVSHRFSFEQIPAAHRQIETGKTRGKVVVFL